MKNSVKSLMLAMGFLVILGVFCYGGDWHKPYAHLNIFTLSQNSFDGALFVNHCTEEGVNLVDPYSKISLLHVAAAGGRVGDVVRFLDNGVDINMRALFGETPLHIAVDEGRRDVVNILLERGADVNIQSSFSEMSVTVSPLLTAVFRQDFEMVKLLISAKADINCILRQPKRTTTVLGAAAEQGCTEIVALLISAGADPDVFFSNEDGVKVTVLMDMVMHRKVEMVKSLLSLGVNPGITCMLPGGKEFSPLMVAILKDEPMIVELLLAKGASLNDFLEKSDKDDIAAFLEVARKCKNIKIDAILRGTGVGLVYSL